MLIFLFFTIIFCHLLRLIPSVPNIIKMKRLYLTKFKEACTHKERKNKEEMERVQERKFQSFKLIDSAIA